MPVYLNKTRDVAAKSSVTPRIHVRYKLLRPEDAAWRSYKTPRETAEIPETSRVSIHLFKSCLIMRTLVVIGIYITTVIDLDCIHHT